MGGGKYLNNHQGGADNLRLASHNPIGQNNKCSLWTLHQYEPEVPSSVAQVERDGLKDGMHLQGNQIVIVRNGMKYNTNGQRIDM